MALTYGVSSTEQTFTANPTSIAVNYPTGIAAGSLLVLTVGCHPDTKTVSTPAGGWVAPANSNQTGGAGTFGAGTGPCRTAMFYKIADGTETGTLAVTVSSVASSLCWAVMVRIESGSDLYDIVCTNGVDSSGGASWSTTGAAQLDITTGDFLLIHCTVPTAASDPTTVSSESVTIPSCTFSFSFGDTIVVETATGNDIAGRGVGGSITAGTATGAPGHTCTWPATATNIAGPEIYMRIREDTGTDAAAGHAVLTTTAQQPNINAQSNSGSASLALAGNDAKSNVRPNSGNAVLSTGAGQVSSNVTTNIEHSVLSTTANNALASISVFAGCANIALVSNGATVDLAGSTNAMAGEAILGLVSGNVSSNVVTNIGHATLTLIGNNSLINAGASPPNGALSLVTNSPSASVSVSAECANISTVADNLTSKVNPTSGSATLSLFSQQPSIITGSFVNAMAECANVAVTTNNPSLSISQNALPGCAAVTVTTNGPRSALSLSAQGANLVAQAAVPSAVTAVFANSGVATLVASGKDVSVVTSSNALAECASISCAAFNGAPTTIVPDPDLIIVEEINGFVVVRSAPEGLIVRNDIDYIKVSD